MLEISETPARCVRFGRYGWPTVVRALRWASLIVLLSGGFATAQDLTITDLEVTQSIQYLGNPSFADNSLTLVRGRQTVVRMYVGGAGLPLGGVDGSLRVLVNGAELTGSPFSPANGPITAPSSPAVSYTHLTLPTICFKCRSRWWGGD